MKLDGSQKIAAPRSVVWRALTDTAVLQRSIPGCEKLEPVSEGSYRGVFKAGVGTIKGTFTGEFTLSEVKEGKGYTLSSRAKSAVGFVDAKVTVQLEDEGKSTVVRFAGDLKAGGMLASVGGRLMEAASQKNMHDMFANLARECAALQHAAGKKH